MLYKKGDKFTIEITDVMTGEDGKTVYRMNDFASLVFDQSGLDRLEKAEEPVESEKKSSFKRVPDGFEYYFITACGDIAAPTDLSAGIDKNRFAVANYCTDKSLMEQRALHETLNRLLWRYSEEHEGDPEWNMTKQHWYILKDKCNGGALDTDYNEAYHVFGVPYFVSEAIALEAIHDIVEPFMAVHPEFVW